MDMQEPTHQSDLGALTEIINAMRPLDEDIRLRVHAAVGAYFNLPTVQAPSLDEITNAPDTGSKPSGNLADFIVHANTKTGIDITLIAAYWLQFREDNPDGFKTLAISKELKAAGHKFSNLTRNLTLLAGKRKKYLISTGGSGKGKIWMVSALGKAVAEKMLHGED